MLVGTALHPETPDVGLNEFVVQTSIEPATAVTVDPAVGTVVPVAAHQAVQSVDAQTWDWRAEVVAQADSELALGTWR